MRDIIYISGLKGLKYLIASSFMKIVRRVMANSISYVPARISDRHHGCRDLNRALQILGYGSWNELWPGKLDCVLVICL